MLHPLFHLIMKSPWIYKLVFKLLYYIVFHIGNTSHGKIQFITCNWQINSSTCGIQFKLHLKKTTFWGFFFFLSKKTSNMALENTESKGQIEVGQEKNCFRFALHRTLMSRSEIISSEYIFSTSLHCYKDSEIYLHLVW